MRFRRSGHRYWRFGIGFSCLSWFFLSFLVFMFFLVFLSFLFFPGVDLSDLAIELRVDLGVLGMDQGELAVHLAVDLDAL